MTSQGQRFRRRALRRGYKVDEVDSFLDRVEATLAGEPIEHPVGADEVHDVVFRVRFGGYDEWQVDLHLDRVERQLAELSQQGPGFGPGPDGREPHGYAPDRMGPPPGGPGPGPGPGAGPGPGGGPPAVGGPGPMSAPGPGQGAFPPPGPPAPAYADSGYDDRYAERYDERYEEPTYGGYDGHQPRPGHLSGGERFASDATSEMHLGDPGGRPMSPYGPPEPAPPAAGPGGPGGPGHGAPAGPPPGMAGPPPGPEPGPAALPRRQPGPPPPGGPGGPPPSGPPPGSPPAGMGGPGSPPPSQAPMSGMPAPGPGYSSGYGAADYGPPPDQAGYGPASGDLQRLDELRRGFQPRRFGSGYDRAQVDRLFDEVMAGVSGQGPLPAGEADLDPARFDLVPGGYFEAEVDRALHEVRDILRRR